MGRDILLFAGLVVMFCCQAFATLVYSNTTNDTGDTLSYAANGFTQIGDQIQLIGSQRYADTATVQLYNGGDAGTFDATLRLFEVGAPVGAQIFSNFLVSGVVAPLNDVVTFQISLPHIPVPDNLIFTIEVNNQSSGVNIFGPTLFDPPDYGFSDSTFAIAYDGSSFLQTGTINQNVYFALDASPAPEPATALTTGVALLGLAVIRRRKR